MELVRFFSVILKLAIALALIGQLKSCTLELLGHAAKSSDQGWVSYAQYTKLLTHNRSQKP